MKKYLLLTFVIMAATTLAGCGFVESYTNYSYDPPSFFGGLWHGLLAPYSLLVRWFMEVEMYAFPNSGWLYDFGFLFGVAGSLPIGWLAAIISIIIYFL